MVTGSCCPSSAICIGTHIANNYVTHNFLTYIEPTTLSAAHGVQIWIVKSFLTFSGFREQVLKGLLYTDHPGYMLYILHLDLTHKGICLEVHMLAVYI